MESSGFTPRRHGNSSHSNCSSLVEEGVQKSPPSVTRAHSFGSADLNRKERPTVSRAHSMSSADRSSSPKSKQDTWKQRCIRSKSYEKLSLRLQSASDEDFCANPEIVCPTEDDNENAEEPKTPDTAKRVTFAEIAQRKKNMSLPVQPLIDSSEGNGRLDTGKHSDEGVFSGEWTEGGNECEDKRRWSEKERKERLNSEGIEVDEVDEDDGIIENVSGNEVAMEESLKLRRESLESEKAEDASGRSRLFSDPGPKLTNDEVTLRDNLSSYQLPAMKGWQKDGDAEEEMTSYVAIETPPDNIPLSPSCSGEFILVDLRRKKALVSAVNSAVDAILDHFGEAREPAAKARLGNSSKTPNIGHLVLRYLCPAMLALVEDGLRPFLRNPIVGRVKNNVWNVVEASTQMGPATKSLNKLANHLGKTGQMWDINMRFNAFICGLLNLKAVELWLTHLQARYDIVQKHYIPEAFLTLSYTAGRQLFDDVVVIVQPLSLLPFALDTQFEFNIKQEEMEREIGKQRLKEEAARTSPRSTFQMMTGKRIPRYQPSGRMEEDRHEEQEEEVMVIDRRPEETPVDQDQTPKEKVDSVVAGEDQQPTEQPKNQSWWFQLMNSTPVEAAFDRKTSETTSTISETSSEANATSVRSKLWLSNLIGAGPRPNQEARSKVKVPVTQEVKKEDQQNTPNGKKSRWASFSSSLIQAVDRVLLPTSSRTPPPSPRQHHSNQTPPSSPRQHHSNQTPPSSPRQQHSNQMPFPSPRQQHSNKTTRREQIVAQEHRKDGKRVVKALCHHLATEDGQLSLTKGDILTVVRQVDDDWLLCCHGNKTGLVLTGCVDDLDLL
ncbi:iporin-like isoform X3 [Branchiostoma floridae]|uniref:Iporin-like isoform X3 n=1 Tax=Branchiostoma floridae TaxID=7739 RepID=A0A9J7KW94_BRAFL|nr:iporin-like isoform X3 [Branchiostoma floridae]